MKKLLLFAAVAVFSFSTVQSQELRLGAKAGVNFASIGGDGADELDGLTSFHIGALAEIPINEKFSVQPELLYSSQGAKAEFSETYMGQTISFKYKRKLDYINVPIMAKYYVIEGLSIEAGPQFGILVSAKGESETEGGVVGPHSENVDIKDSHNTLDIGFGLGATYRLNNGIFFSARYVLGITNMIKDQDSDFGDEEFEKFKQHNNVIQLSLGYSF
ncbi:MAG: porin family protein [Aequorivita sp.]